MRLTWTRGRSLVDCSLRDCTLMVFAATAAVLQLAGLARAQYSPYGNPAPQAYGVQQQNYSAQPSYQNYGMGQSNPQYTAMAYYGNEQAAPAPAPMPAQMPSQDYSAMPTQSYPESVPMAQQGGGYGGNCNSGCGCENGYYNTFEPGCGYGCGGHQCGLPRTCGNYCMSGCGCGCGPRWFGGIYGLLMERTRCDYQALGFSADDAPPYYPTDDEIVLYNNQADIGYQGGFEVRFGMYCGGRGGCGPMGRPYASACGGSACDPCGGGMMNCDSCCGAGGCGGGGCGCGPTHAWEFGYWQLFEDDGYYAVADSVAGGDRLHGMVDFRGLQYNAAGAYRSMNVFFDYGPATTDNTAPYDVEVRQLAVRNTFSAQNIEINLMRLPMSCCNSCCGCGPRCEMTAMAGFRIMRFDDDFWLRSDFELMNTNELQYIAYNVEADNTLYGAQIGGSGTYRCGCSGRLAFHMGTAVGLYGNHMEVTQGFASTTGLIQLGNNGNAVPPYEYADDDIAMVGEIRLGASYMCHCNWRLYTGWRLLGISGVAVAQDQIPTNFGSPQQLSYVDCDGSIILHGLQTGLEFIY